MFRSVAAVFDSSGKHVAIFNHLEPLHQDDVLGHHAWEWATPTQAEVIKYHFFRCVETGERQVYRVMSEVPGRDHTAFFLVKLKRFTVGTEHLLLCLATLVPIGIASLTEKETDFLVMVGKSGSQAELAEALGVTRSAVTQQEARLRKKIGVESRYELRRIGQELLEERNAHGG